MPRVRGDRGGGRVTRPSDTQWDALIDLCTACRVKPRDVARVAYGCPPRDLTGEQVSSLCRLLTNAQSAGTWQSYRPLEALKRFARGEPFDRPNGETMKVPSRRLGESPEEWVCRVFGFDRPREEECKSCGGTGRRTVKPRALSRLAVGRLLLWQPRGSLPVRTLPDRLRRPPLEVLHASREWLGPDATMDTVVAVYEQYATMIEGEAARE